MYDNYFLKEKTVYEILKELKIIPYKIKTLKLESYLRWSKEEEKIGFKSILKKLSEKINVSLKYYYFLMHKLLVFVLIRSDISV